MDIIDSHIHTNVNHRQTAQFCIEHGIDFSWKGLQSSFRKNKIKGAIAITTSHEAPTPGEADLFREQAHKDSRLFPVCSIHPEFTGAGDLKKVEKLFEEKVIVGIKIFPGYHPVYPSDPRYVPFYKLAGTYKVPVIIHTGDTFGNEFLIKYAHPLDIDEIAVRFPQTTFVIAHLGNPWVRDAAELVSKNENVYADLSAFCIGRSKGSEDHIFQDIQYALSYTGNPGKFLYGSDWPLVDMGEYISLIKKIVPRKFHGKIFFDNAKKIFNLNV